MFFMYVYIHYDIKVVLESNSMVDNNYSAKLYACSCHYEISIS